MAAFYFKFYPGDYLRDTQNLSEKAQVAYDRIMCEHMRNMCITYDQHKFFTKRLSDDEKEELSMVLTDTGAGYMISWVSESVAKSYAYSGSRSKNRLSETPQSYDEHMKTYDRHMESNSNSNSNSSIKNKKGDEKKELNYSFDHFWNLYDKKVGDRAKISKKWEQLTDHERFQAVLHIPEYLKAQPDKKYRKDPATYLNNKSFNDEIIYSNGQQTTTTGRNTGSNGGGADFFADIIHQNTGG